MVVGRAVIGLQGIIFVVLWLVMFGVEVWAFVDAAIRPAGAYVRAGKASKTVWVLVTGIAAAVGFGGAPTAGGFASFGGLLSLAAIFAAIFYLVDVRPAVRNRRPPRPPRQGRGGW
jgi:hypothetical protein